MADNTQQNILLTVSVETQDAIKEIAAAQIAVQNLRAEIAKLTDDYKTNTTQINANKDKIKELGAEIKNKETQVLNELKNIDTNTASLSKLSLQYQITIEKAKALADAYGENSTQALIASDAVTKMSEKLKNSTTAVDQNEKSSGKLGDTLKTVGTVVGVFVPEVGAAIKVLGNLSRVFDAVKSVMESTQTTFNQFKSGLEGLSTSWNYFKKSLASGDFSFSGLKNAYKAGKDFYNEMQDIHTSSAAISVEEAKINNQILKLTGISRDATKSNKERLDASKKIVELTNQESALKQSVADRNYNAAMKKITGLTGLSKIEYESFMENYNKRDFPAMKQSATMYNSLKNSIKNYMDPAELLNPKQLEVYVKLYKQKLKEIDPKGVMNYGDKAIEKAQQASTYAVENMYNTQTKVLAKTLTAYGKTTAAEIDNVTNLYTISIKAQGESTKGAQNANASQHSLAKELSDQDKAAAAKKDQDAKEAEAKRKAAAEQRRQTRDKEYTDQEARDQAAILKTEKNTQESLDTEIKLIQDQQAHKIYDAQGNEAQITLINANAEKEIFDKKKEYEDALKDLKEKTLSFLKKNLEMQVADRQKATEEEIKSLQLLTKEGKLNANELALYTVAVKKQEAEDIKNIKLKSLKEQEALIDAQLDQKYALRLARAVGDEEEITDLMIAKEKERLAKLKQEKAIADARVSHKSKDKAKDNKDQDVADAAGVAVTNSENNLNALTIKQTQQKYAAELIAARHSAEETYKIKRKELADELMLSNLGANEQAKIQAEIQDLDQAHTLKKIENAKEWADKSIELGSQVSSLFKALGDAEVQKAENDNNSKKTALDNQLSSGLITKKQYDKEVAKSEADLAAKKKKVAQDQAKREKLINLFNVAVNTGEAVAKIMTTIGVLQSNPLTVAYVPVAYASLAYTIAAGAAQAAVIAATPLPTAGRGMLLRGKSHAQGGIPIEVEGGEAIINKRSTAMYGSVLSAINEAGGGVKFAGGGMVGKYATGGMVNYAFSNDGGYSARTQANAITAADMHQAMVAAVSKVKVYTTVEDYRKADVNYTNIVSSGTV